VEKYIGSRVTVKGYYRRDLIPMVEIVEMEVDGERIKPNFRLLWILGIISLFLLGVFVTFLGILMLLP